MKVLNHCLLVLIVVLLIGNRMVKTSLDKSNSHVNQCNKYGFLKLKEDFRYVDCYMCAKLMRSIAIYKNCCTYDGKYVSFCEVFLG